MSEDAARLGDLPFPRAVEVWLEEHKKYIEARTYRDYLQFSRRLCEFLGSVLLKDVHIGHYRSYQDWRKQPRTYQIQNHGTVQTKRTQGAGNELINKELGMLEQMQKSAIMTILHGRAITLWDAIKDFYRPLPIDNEGAGKSFTAEEKGRLLLAIEAGIAANSTNRSQCGCHCARIMVKSGLAFGELRKLRRKDVDLITREIHIVYKPKNKKARMRTLPIDGTAYESFVWLVARWERLGGSNPDEFLLPHRASGHCGITDFAKPMGSIKRVWAKLCEQAGIEARMYDCRVNAETEALSNPEIPLYAAKAYFGQISDRMVRRYYKPHKDSLRKITRMLSE